jgi:hypothetical protein
MAKHKIELPYSGRGTSTEVRSEGGGKPEFRDVQALLLPRRKADLKELVRKFLETDGKLRHRAASRQGDWTGFKQHPFNYESADVFASYNVHHSACIEAKVMATVGLGFVRATVEEEVEQITPIEQAEQDQANIDADRELKGREIDVKEKQAAKRPAAVKKAMVKQPKIDQATGKPELEARSEVSRVLDPLCKTTFQDVLIKMEYDRASKGSGFIEVTRGEDGAPAGIHHAPANSVFVVVDDDEGNFHYEVVGLSNGGPWSRVFAAYGDVDGLIERASKNGGYLPGVAGDIRLNRATKRPGRPPKSNSRAQDRLSEIIQFDLPSPVSRHYGYVEWLSATIRLELVQCLHRHTYDFFLNRGVPEYILAIVGAKIQKKDWDRLEEKMQAHIGPGNSHKSMQINIPEKGAEVQLHKLALEGKTDGLFHELDEALAVGIVSAHGVPPLLAGIQIPGKLGATNELPNALMAFQSLKIGPRQEQIEQKLQNTIGQEMGLDEKELKLRTILETIDVNKADTIGRMREPLAAAGGRDLSAGVKN